MGLKSFRNALLLGAAALGMGAASAALMPAYAQEATRTYSIGPQELDDALREFGRQTGRDILFAPDAVAGKRSPGVEGEMTERQALEALLAGTGLTFQQTASNAYAVQDPASPTQLGAADETPSVEADEEIVVTGSRIRGAPPTSPLISFDREAIDQAGHSTTQDFLEVLPQNFGGGAEGTGGDGLFGVGSRRETNFTGASGVNLRGLGTSSTLVLLNGHRLAPSQFGSTVDVSLIPLEAVERIDVLTDGSSAIYGSDAVAGVVNIILRRDYEGAQTRIRAGGTSDAGRAEQTISQLFGTNWTSGSSVLTLQYQRQDALSASDRSFSAAVPAPTDLLPRDESLGLVLNLQQDLSSTVTGFADILLSERQVDRRFSTAARTDSSFAEAATYTANLGLRWALGDRWTVEPSLQFSRNEADQDLYRTTFSTGVTVLQSSQETAYEIASAEVVVQGTLLTLPGGDVQTAFGASFRDESFIQQIAGQPDQMAEREVSAAFAEVLIPIVGRRNQGPLLQALDLTGALRTDDYSDFGGTTNGRIGVLWQPVDDLVFRASFAESFRAPAANDVLRSASGNFLFTFNFANPAGPGNVPIFLLTGSKPGLQPEEAEITSYGFDYTPGWLDGLTVTANFYDVSYVNRIIVPPFTTQALLSPNVYGSLITSLPDAAAAQAFLDNAIANGADYFDLLGGGVAAVRFAYDARQQNAAFVEQSGLDLSISYRRFFGDHNVTFNASVGTIDHIDTAFSQSSQPVDLVDTFANPVDLRARVGFGWEYNAFRAYAAANYVDSYTNTTPAIDVPIDSWTTVDLNAGINLGELFQAPAVRGTQLSFFVSNVFDEEPPFVAPQTPTSIAYDAANANPVGRSWAIELRRSW